MVSCQQRKNIVMRGWNFIVQKYSRDPPRNLIIIKISEPFPFQPNTFQVTDLVQLWSNFLESPNQFRRKVLARLWASCSWRNLILRKYLPVQFRKQLEGRKLHNIRKESPRQQPKSPLYRSIPLGARPVQASLLKYIWWRDIDIVSSDT